jgi:hypothetical protein
MTTYIRVPPTEPTYKEILVPAEPEVDAVEICRLVAEDGLSTPSGANASHPIYTTTVIGGGLEGSAANAGRTTATKVLPTQHVGADGNPLPSGHATDPVYVNTEMIPDAANTGRSTATLVLPTQHVGADGVPMPSGSSPAAPLHTKLVAYTAAACGTTATRDAGKTEAAPTAVGDGVPLPATGAKETIALYADITAAGASTIIGIIWLYCALPSVGSTWFPTRQITLGNAAAVIADTTGAIGAVAEISWPDGASRVAWQGLDDTGSPTHRYITVVAE